MNQLLSKSSSKTTDDTYTYAYNMKGSRTSMTSGGVNTTAVYDSLGRLTKETLTDGTVKEYTYDMNGNRKSFKLTKDNTVQYTLTYDYDKRNQLTKVYENGTVKAQYEYNADGTLKKSSYGSRTTDYSYNLAQLLTEVNNANGSTQISKYNYTYYVDGNQKTKEESVAGTSQGTTTYTYDGLNRLKKEQAPDKTMTYTYDYYGNRSQLSVTGDEVYTTSYAYDKNNRLTKQTKTSGKVSDITEYWYDPNGNQISSMTITSGITPINRSIGIEQAGGANNSISEYDSWNQLTSTMQNGKTASYTYNGDGLRMSKTVDGVTTSHIWDGTNIAADVTSGTVTKYIRGIQLISSKTGSSESFYNFNGHGDVVQLTNSSAAITKQYSYDAFGVEQNKTDSDTNPFRYCGEYYDTETDSIYLRARYYSPVAGRFITEDPIKDGLNWYSYCGGNPVMQVDPTGEYAFLANWNELMSGVNKYGWSVTARAQVLSDDAKNMAIKYADTVGYYSISKEFWGPTYGYHYTKHYDTWDNPVDAMRHMSWNSMLTREFGIETAEFFANNHEYYNLKDTNNWIISEGNGVVITKMNQPTLMDLWNNQVGRALATDPSLYNLNYNQLFDYAVDNNLLILDANTTYDFYGVNSYINEADWTVTVKWDLKTGNLTFMKDGLPNITLAVGI